MCRAYETRFYMIDMTAQEIALLLQNARVGRLGMAAPDGRPYTIPLRFVWLNGCLYVRLAHYGRKADILEANNRVCFESDAFTDDFSQYASVLAEGTVVDVTDPVEKEEALFRYHEKYSRLCGIGLPPRPVTISGVALRKLIVQSLTGRKREPDDAIIPVLRPGAVARQVRRQKRSTTHAKA